MEAKLLEGYHNPKGFWKGLAAINQFGKNNPKCFYLGQAL